MGATSGNPMYDIIQMLAGLVIFVLLLRFLMRFAHTDWHHPITKFIAKVTNPLCVPFNKIIPVKGRWDWSALIAAFAVQALTMFFLNWLFTTGAGVAYLLLASLVNVTMHFLEMLFWLIIIQVIISWVSPGYNPNTAIIEQLTRPILAPFQRIIPPVSGLDLSPIAAIMTIFILKTLVIGIIY